MADGIFNLCGRRTVQLTKDGRTYSLAVRILENYAAKESAILQRPGSAFEGIDKIANARVREAAIKVAAEVAARPQIATMQDEDRFDHSFRGLAWSVWQALSINHPDEFPPNATAEQAVQLGCDFIAWFGDVAAVVQAIHRAEEKDILGNSKAPTETPG